MEASAQGRRRRENPQNSPNGKRQPGSAGGGAGRAGASLRDLIQGCARRTVPVASGGAPRSCPPDASEAPLVRRGRALASREEAGAGAALDASPGSSGRPRGLREAAGAVGLDGRVWGPTLPAPGAARDSGAPGAVVRAGGDADARPSADSPELARRAPQASQLLLWGGSSHPRRRGGFALASLHARGPQRRRDVASLGTSCGVRRGGPAPCS